MPAWRWAMYGTALFILLAGALLVLLMFGTMPRLRLPTLPKLRLPQRANGRHRVQRERRNQVRYTKPALGLLERDDAQEIPAIDGQPRPYFFGNQAQHRHEQTEEVSW